MTLMKHLLVAMSVVLLPTPIHAQKPQIQCPGENTVEMRYCAGVSWEQSTDQLKRKLPMALLKEFRPLNNQGDPERAP